MKKAILLSAAILLTGTGAANASGFHLSIFAPAPVYSAPAPVYVARPRPVYYESYPTYYASAYPQYNYEYNYWYYVDGRGNRQMCDRYGRRIHGHRGHDRDDRHYRRY